MDDCWRQHRLTRKVKEDLGDNRDHSRDRRKRKEHPSSSSSNTYEREREEWSRKKVSSFRF
jgi:hypothetical protein